MSSFEFNKIFAAILVAGITAMLGGFIAEVLIHPHALEQDAVAVEGEVESAGGAAAGPAMPEPILNLIATADVAKGEKLSKACAACHSFNKGEPAKVGPNLWGVVGGPKAHMSGFAYSEDMEKKGGAWGYSDLNHFLWKPKSFVAGTKMNFIGLKKPEDRAALIAWLRTMSDSPDPFPNQAEIDQEAKELAPPAPAEGEAAAPADGAPAKEGEAPADKKEPEKKAAGH